MKLFDIDETRNDRLIQKFNMHCSCESTRRCYKNKVEFGCGYIKVVEDKISQVCEVAHVGEHPLWWVALLD